MESAGAPARPRADLELGPRVAYALPLAALVLVAVAAGDELFALAAATLAVLAALELLRLVRVPGLVAAAAAATCAALVAVALLAGREGLVPVLAAALPLLLAAAAAAPRADRARAAAFGLLAVVWVGLALAHAVLLRELDHGGALVVVALLATFLGDTAAHVVGARFGRRPLAPSISPRKTVEGAVAGLVGGTGAVVAFAALAHEWLGLHEALLLGLAGCVAAQAGDLCESALKRSVGAKDSGTLLGPHGGVLDRVDAALFAVVTVYYVALALL